MSTDEYTPTADEVRERYVGESYYSSCPTERDADQEERDGAAFDRWLAEHDRQVAEQTLRDAAAAANREWLRLKDGPWGSNPTDQAVLAFATRAVDWLLARADSAAPAPCPSCGGVGTHGEVHVRYGNGGGGNKPCPAAPACPTTDDRARSQGDGVNWTFEEWQEWSNEVASAMPDEWDGDEAQEDLILRFVQRAADHLRTCPTVPRADDDDAERVTAFALAIKAAEAKIPGTDNRVARRMYADAWADGYLASRPTTPTPTVSEERVERAARVIDAGAFVGPAGFNAPGMAQRRSAARSQAREVLAALGIAVTTDGGEG